jgi:hypothetical protein
MLKRSFEKEQRAPTGDYLELVMRIEEYVSREESKVSGEQAWEDGLPNFPVGR